MLLEAGDERRSEVKLYKVLDGDKPCNGGSGWYSLPTKNENGTWTPGEWMPDIEGRLEPCKNGYHLCRATDLIEWLGPDIYEAEYRGEIVVADKKAVARSVRLLRKIEAWNERSARLFACWCTRQVWHLLDDDRIKESVAAAERYANGEATKKELDAAGAAAWAAQIAKLLEMLGIDNG